MENRKSKKKAILWWSAMALCLGVFLFAGFFMIKTIRKYGRGKDIYQEVEELFLVDNKQKESKKEKESHSDNQGKLPENKKEVEELVNQGNENFQWNYQLMQEYNQDAVGYIRNMDTISYPVAKTDNNSYYLNHMINGEENSTGAIFMDCECEKEFDSSNVILYGHNRRDGSMFGTLSNYLNQEYALEHPYLYVYTKDKILLYYVFAAYEGKTDDECYTISFNDKHSLNEWVENCKSKSVVEMPINTQKIKTKKIITLSTCSEDSINRTLVQGILIGNYKGTK